MTEIITVYKNNCGAQFTIEKETPEYVYIIDTGHNHTMTVTNDAEGVVEMLFNEHGLGDRRLFYKDSEGQVDELKHSGARFTGYSPGHKGIDL